MKYFDSALVVVIYGEGGAGRGWEARARRQILARTNSLVTSCDTNNVSFDYTWYIALIHSLRETCLIYKPASLLVVTTPKTHSGHLIKFRSSKNG